jgi:hypothetical protein
LSDTQSGSGTNPPTTPPVTPPTEGNKTAKISIDEALAENETLKKERENLQGTILELTEQLKAANDVLEGQEKAKLISDILSRSSFKLDELTGKKVEDLQQIRGTLDYATAPTFKPIRFGAVGGDVTDKEKGLTVGDLSVVTAEKRKRATERR